MWQKSFEYKDLKSKKNANKDCSYISFLIKAVLFLHERTMFRSQNTVLLYLTILGDLSHATSRGWLWITHSYNVVFVIHLWFDQSCYKNHICIQNIICISWYDYIWLQITKNSKFSASGWMFSAHVHQEPVNDFSRLL